MKYAVEKCGQKGLVTITRKSIWRICIFWEILG